MKRGETKNEPNFWLKIKKLRLSVHEWEDEKTEHKYIFEKRISNKIILSSAKKTAIANILAGLVFLFIFPVAESSGGNMQKLGCFSQIIIGF